jgi:nucleolar protein 56
MIPLCSASKWVLDSLDSHHFDSEWYGYHFPELVKIVNDNHLYAKLARVIGRRTTLNEESIPSLEEIVQDTAKATQIVEAARSSMGAFMS